MHLSDVCNFFVTGDIDGGALRSLRGDWKI